MPTIGTKSEGGVPRPFRPFVMPDEQARDGSALWFLMAPKGRAETVMLPDAGMFHVK